MAREGGNAWLIGRCITEEAGALALLPVSSVAGFWWGCLHGLSFFES